MIYNEIKNPFRIYDSIDKQDQHSKSAGKVFEYNFLSPSDTVLPFQLAVPLPPGGDDPLISDWFLRYENGSTAVPYDFSSVISLLEINITMSGLAYITYKADTMILPPAATLNIQPGRYFMVLIVDGVEYPSEVFAVCQQFSIHDQDIPYLKFEYDNTGDDGAGDLGEIMYQTGYKNLMYLDVDILQEEPNVEEEGHENGAKEFIPDFSRYVENFRIEDMMPYFLADAMMVMSIHKNVVVTLPHKLYSAKIRNMKATMKQEAVNNAYRMEFTFAQDSRYINTSCSNKIDIFSGATGVVTQATGVARGDLAGTIDYTFTLGGNATKVRIKDISHVNPLCPGHNTNIEFPISVNAGSHAGYANATHIIHLVPVTVFMGVEYEGTPFEISVFVSGSIACP